MSKFLAYAKTSTYQLAICPITGLSLEIRTPAIPSHKVLTYQNPLSIPVNAIGIAKLPYKEKLSIGKDILAASLLSLLSHYSLIQDKCSSVERKEAIEQASPYLLHSLLFIISSSSKATIRNWPHISFADSSPVQLLSDYYAIISGKLETPSSSHYTSISSTSSIKRKKQVRQVTPSLREEMKSLASSIYPLLSTKIQQVIKVVIQGNNLYSLNPSLKEKLITKLESLDSLSASSFASILRNASNEEEEDITQHFKSEQVKSARDILNEKLGKIKIEEEVKEVEDLFYPSFKHRDCDACEFEMKDCKSLAYCYQLEAEKEQQLSSLLGEIKEIADDMGIENNLEYIEEEEEEFPKEEDEDREEEEEGEDDDF